MWSVTPTGFSAQEFRDALLLRCAIVQEGVLQTYRVPSFFCDGCDEKFSVRHALECQKVVSSSHITTSNEIRDELSDLMICATLPCFQTALSPFPRFARIHSRTSRESSFCGGGVLNVRTVATVGYLYRDNFLKRSMMF